MQCTHCGSNEVVKHGKNYHSGTARYLCKSCNRHFTPNPKAPRYDKQMHETAIRMHLDGVSQRRIARFLNVCQQTVANWLNKAGDKASQLQTPLPATDCAETVAELDELHTFVGKKRPNSTSQRA